MTVWGQLGLPGGSTEEMCSMPVRYTRCQQDKALVKCICQGSEKDPSSAKPVLMSLPRGEPT